MKTLSKAVTATALAASLLLSGGSAMALANDNSPINSSTAPAATTEADSLTRMITLKPTAFKVSDQLGESATAGLPWISQNYPFSPAPIAASRVHTSADGSTWRMISLEHCSVRSAYFVADSDVATDEPRPADTEVENLRTGTATADNDDVQAYASQFTGTGKLKPQAPIYGRTVDAAPIYLAASDALEAPMTPVFEEGGKQWVRIIAPGMSTGGLVLASDVVSFEPTTCGPNAAMPFDVVAVPESVTSGGFSIEMLDAAQDAYLANWDADVARRDGTPEEIIAAERKAADKNATYNRYKAASNAADDGRVYAKIKAAAVDAATEHQVNAEVSK